MLLTSCCLLYSLLSSLWVMSQATWYHSNSSSRVSADRSNWRLSSSRLCRVNTWDFPFLPFFTGYQGGDRSIWWIFFKMMDRLGFKNNSNYASEMTHSLECWIWRCLQRPDTIHRVGCRPCPALKHKSLTQILWSQSSCRTVIWFQNFTCWLISGVVFLETSSTWLAGKKYCTFPP